MSRIALPVGSRLEGVESRDGLAIERRVEHGREENLAVPDFDGVYTAYFRHVTRWARALGGLDADVEDLAQDVFLVARRKLAGYRGPSMSAWLYGITRKTVSDYRRRAWIRHIVRGSSPLVASAAATEDDPSEAAERLEARRVLGRILAKMSSVRRTALILFEIEGYSGEEIAELEQIPVSTVYTRLHHARGELLRLIVQTSRGAS